MIIKREYKHYRKKIVINKTKTHIILRIYIKKKNEKMRIGVEKKIFSDILLYVNKSQYERGLYSWQLKN